MKSAVCADCKSKMTGKKRWWAAAPWECVELLVSAIFNILCMIFMISSAVTSHLLTSLNEILKLSPSIDVTVDESHTDAGDDGLPPVVLIHGLFGFGEGKMGGLSYFGGAEKMDKKVFVPDLGSLTSIHDRARELFYYLKGGQVDYGEEHSKAAGHSQFGKVYKRGNYPEWDEDHPVHFVAHSAGAQVVRVLQQMLADKAFKGHENTSENWVLSQTSIAGALNGSTRTYLDGMMPEDWRRMKPIGLINLCHYGIIILEWLDISFVKAFYNFGFDHFKMSRKKIGFSGLIDYLLGNIGPFASGDWVIPDITLQGSMKINSCLKTFPNTYYFSYACKKTTKFFGVKVPSRVLEMHPLLWLRSWQMCQWQFPKEVEVPYKGYRDEDWQDNDGALNTIAMTHPRFPVEHPSRFVTEDSECQTMEPGIWYYKILEADHMLFVINRERAGIQFDIMYDSIFKRCRRHALRTKRIATLMPNQRVPQ